MANYNSFLIISKRLSDLGASEYQYLYEEGKVKWRNENKEIVAYANCKAILSFASTNNSYRWGLFPNTPTLDKPEWTEGMVYDVTEEVARQVALKAALEYGSEFMFAGSWVTLTIYLACNDIIFESDSADKSAPWHPVVGDMSKYSDLVNSIINQIK